MLCGAPVWLGWEKIWEWNTCKSFCSLNVVQMYLDLLFFLTIFLYKQGHSFPFPVDYFMNSLSCSLFYQMRCSQWSLWPWLHRVFCSLSLLPLWVRKRNIFSKLIPESRPSDWRNVRVRAYRRVTGHEYKYFIVFCGLKRVNCTWCYCSHWHIELQCYVPLCTGLLYFTTVATGNYSV